MKIKEIVIAVGFIFDCNTVGGGEFKQGSQTPFLCQNFENKPRDMNGKYNAHTISLK